MKNVIYLFVGGAYRPDLITVFTRDAPIAIFLAYSDFRFFWKCDLPMPIPIFFLRTIIAYTNKNLCKFQCKNYLHNKINY